MLSVTAVPPFNPPGLNNAQSFKTKAKIFNRPPPPPQKVSLIGSVP